LQLLFAWKHIQELPFYISALFRRTLMVVSDGPLSSRDVAMVWASKHGGFTSELKYRGAVAFSRHPVMEANGDVCAEDQWQNR
jgi:hypothetical protein